MPHASMGSPGALWGTGKSTLMGDTIQGLGLGPVFGPGYFGLVRDSEIVNIPFTNSRNVCHSGMLLAGIQVIRWMPARNMLA